MKTKRFLTVVIIAGFAFLFNSCGYKALGSGNLIKEQGTYKNSQPYPKQTEQTWSKNACGAFSSAYYLSETGQIPADKIRDAAKEIYKAVKFVKSAGFGDYSDPFKIAMVISKYSHSVDFKINKKNASSDGEKLMLLLAEKIGAPDLTDISDISHALKKNEYVIEIVVPSPYVDLKNPMHNELHYVLSYWKDDVLYTLDPLRGKEYPRKHFIDGTIRKWNFCNAGIFIEP